MLGIIISIFALVASYEIKPVLLWDNKGVTETGWYSSPVYVNSNGTGLIVGSAYSVYALNVDTGELIWKDRHTGAGRTWPGIVKVQDFMKKGDLIFVTAHGGGYVCAWDTKGNKKWCTKVASSEVRGLAVGKLSSTSYYLIFAGIAVSSNKDLMVILNPFGEIVTRRPRNTDNSGYPDGYCYYQCNDNIALGDLNNDGQQEIIQSCDTHYITAYKSDLEPLSSNPKYDADGKHKIWGRVGFNQYESIDIRGWGEYGLRPNFCNSPPTIFDLPTGEKLVAVAGNYHDIETNKNQRYSPFVVRSDRLRYVNASLGYNWTYTPDNHHFLDEKYQNIESCMPNIAAVDLDGDGYAELIYPNNDGLMHCNWLDKSEKWNWPFKVTAESYFRYGSEVAVFRLNETFSSNILERTIIVFSSWGMKNNVTSKGYIHFVNGKGTEVKKFVIPDPSYGTKTYNGALGAPTLFYHLKRTKNLLLTVHSIYSGNVLVEIQNSMNSAILWQTGRGSFFRDGRAHPMDEDLSNSYFADPPSDNPNEDTSSSFVNYSFFVFVIVIFLF